MSDQPDVTKLDPDVAHENPEFERMLERVFEEASKEPAPTEAAEASYYDESDKLYVGREFTDVAEFARWFAVQRLGSRPYNAVGYHHTHKPTGQIWAGLPSLTAIYNYYYNDLEWRPWGLGPHLWVYAGDGPWRPGTPHIYVGTHPAHDGAGIVGRNQRWCHIEHIWDGDVAPFSEVLKRVSGQLLAVLCSRHPHADREIPRQFIRNGGIDNPGSPLGLMYHRDQNPNWVPGALPKSCPGLKVTHENLDPGLLSHVQQHFPWQWPANFAGGDRASQIGSPVTESGASASPAP